VTAGSPLREVLAAIEDGVSTRPEIARRTGLDPVLVDGAVEYLVRARLVVVPMTGSGCPSGGCGDCATGCD
jgi:hypothetical protein